MVTALCNDIGVDVVFSRQLGAFGGAGDIAVGLSTSGNSANLLRAFDEASRRGMLTIGLAGYDGGKMAELYSIDYLFVAPVGLDPPDPGSRRPRSTRCSGITLPPQEVSHVSRHTG